MHSGVQRGFVGAIAGIVHLLRLVEKTEIPKLHVAAGAITSPHRILVHEAHRRSTGAFTIANFGRTPCPCLILHLPVVEC